MLVLFRTWRVGAPGLKVASHFLAMFLFGRKNNAPAASAVPPPSVPVIPVPAAMPTSPPVAAADVVLPVSVSAPVTESEPIPCATPRGVVPGSRRLQQRVKKLRRELRVTGRTLVRQRFAETKPMFVLGSPLPEIASEPLAEVEAPAPLPAMPELAPEATAPTAPPVALDDAALKALVVSAPAFVEMQYELVDLRHQLAALQSKAAEPKIEAAPAIDETGVKALVATAPALVEMQYELVDLRHQMQTLQSELAALRATQSQGPSPLTATQLAIVDANGQMVANVSSEGVLSCSSIVFMAQR